MKIVTYRSVFYFICLLNYLFVLSHFGANAQEWCWTKSMVNEPSYVFNPNNGGINWGYCRKGSAAIKQIKYTITMITSSLPNSGTDSTMKLQIFGSRGMTNLKTLGSLAETGSSKNYEIEDKDIGELNKISLKIDGQTGFRCKRIRISFDSNYKDFQCLERLEPCKSDSNNFSCMTELLPEGDSSYEITLKSSNHMEENLNSPILISLIGQKGISNFQMLSETGIPVGSSAQSVIKTKDIGKPTGYKLKITEKGKFKGSYLIVKTIRTGLVDQFDIKDVNLENPGNDSVTYDSAPNGNKDNKFLLDKEEMNKPKMNSGFNKLFDDAEKLFDKEESGKDKENEEEDDGLITFAPSSSDAAQQMPTGLDNGVNGEFNVHNPDGGLMDEKEKREIVNLDCLQKLVNPDTSSNLFGPIYPTPNINYMNILARCPSDCHKMKGTVYGRGLHPDISPICLSALVDRAVSEYGGIISISIFPGVDKYVILDSPKQRKDRISDKIKTISYYGKPAKSYSIAKVDNVDLSERDIRILDSEGKYSYEGRVEIRIDGKWGAICDKSNNAESAQRICKDLGYNYGSWANQDGKPSFCKSFKNRDFCGSKNVLAHFSTLHCTKDDSSINTCVKKYANPLECGTDNNAIISCTSKEYDSPNQAPDGLIKLVKVVKNELNHIGRLEMFMRGEFKPVCKNGFSTEAAQVACKQMGYLAGELIFPDPALELTKSPEDNSPFAAGEIKCNGTERNLSECNMKLDNIQCTHDLDVVLKCDGIQTGDYTGKSQMKSILEAKEAAPALGRLSAVKIKADCTMTGKDRKFRGDAGSVYLVSCPANCKTHKGNLWGVGIYTLDSNICIAAVHAGVITDEKGGSFAYIKTWGQKYYAGFKRNSIESSEFRDSFLVSFTVASLNSQWKNMWKLWKENSVGTYIEKDIHAELREKSESKINENHMNFSFKNNDHLINSSFLQLEQKLNLNSLPSPFFEWIQPNPSQNFNDKDGGSLLLQENQMRQMSKYQILIKASLTDFRNKKALIFSYSGCNGFNVFLDTNAALVFGDLCNEENQINTGIQFPLNDKTIIWAFYTNGVLKVALFSEKMRKPVAKVFNKILDISQANSVGIGRRADLNEDFFYGYIDFVLVYVDEIPLKEVSKVLDYVENKSKKVDSNEARETKDNRACLSPCIEAPIPGSNGAPAAPRDADPYGSEMFFMPDSLLLGRLGVGTKPSSSKKMGESENQQEDSSITFPSQSSSDDYSNSQNAHKNSNGSSDVINRGRKNKMKINYNNQNLENSASSNSNDRVNPNYNSPNSAVGEYGTYDKSQQNNIESMNLDCYTNLKDKRFSGAPGKIFRVFCPSCSQIKRQIYGSFIYNPLSSICKAANHAGTVSQLKSGYVLVEILPGKKIYNGSIGSEGLISATFGSAEVSFRTKIAFPPKRISCTDAANSDQFANEHVGSKLVVYCPENCSKSNSSKIFGSEVYADMSPICPSAIHFGAINDKGGEVEILIEGSQSFFKSTKSFGITSLSREQYNRAFRFVGNKIAIFHRYTEDFSGSLIEKWSVNPDTNSLNSGSDVWSFKLEEFLVMGERRKIRTISHSGTIKSKLLNNYGSLIALKNAQFSNGRIRSSFLFKDNNLFSLLFRYTDTNSYYAVEIDPKGEKNNFRLISKIDGTYKIIKSATIEFVLEKWVRVQVILSNEKILVFLQHENVRENKPIFAVKADELPRGTIGFAVNGNNSLYISGVKIDEVTNPAGSSGSKGFFDSKNRRTFFALLKSLKPKNRSVYCQGNYKAAGEIASCMIPFNFCKLKCDEEVPEIENILMFKCYRECTKSINDYGNVVKIQKKSWSPQVNEKVDFKPKSEKGFIPAQVLGKKNKIKEGKTRVIYVINFNDDKGNSFRENVEFPSPSLHRCGNMLERRKDCYKEEN